MRFAVGLALLALACTAAQAEELTRHQRALLQATLESVASDVANTPVVTQTTGFGGEAPDRNVPDTAPVLGLESTQLDPKPQCEAAIGSTLTPLASGGFTAQLVFYIKNWATDAVPTPWEFHLFNPAYNQVLGADGLNITSLPQVVNGYIDGTASSVDQAVQPLGANTVKVGVIINVANGNVLPRTVSINYTPCSTITVSGLGSTPNPAPQAPPSPPNPPPANQSPPPPPSPPFVPTSNVGTEGATDAGFFFPVPPTIRQPISISGQQFIGVDGRPVQLRGINWFGFEDGNTAPDGIWFGPDSLTRDVVVIAKRIKALGFNAIRMPFSMMDLWGAKPRIFNWDCAVATKEKFLQSVTDPAVTIPAGMNINYTFPYDVHSTGTSCDDYLPTDSTFNRFIWMIGFLARNGFYILIDNHLQFDTTVYDNNADWLLGWKRIMSAISLDPVAKNYVMYDILNEPDCRGLTWESAGSGRSMTNNYLAMMDQGYTINPDAIFFVEGSSQGGTGANWGDGFSTSPQVVQAGQANDPTRFFKTLLTKPYRKQVVISPHVYPPTITHAVVGFEGASLYNRLTVAHGYLTKQGFCDGTDCQTFIVVPGEFGSRLIDPRDQQFMNDFAKYMNTPGANSDDLHNPITSWFWWCWNQNSADTGGLVGDDWTTIEWPKVNHMKTIGLRPWYSVFSGQAPVATPSPTPTPTAQPTAKPTAAPTAKPTAAPTAKPTAKPTAAPTASSTANVATPKPSAKPTAAPKVTPRPTTKRPTARRRYVKRPTAKKPTTKPTSKPTSTPTVKPTAAPRAAGSATGSIAAYAQCGGQSAPPSAAPPSLGDFAWSTANGPACSDGLTCTRQNEWYWQCLPASK